MRRILLAPLMIALLQAFAWSDAPQEDRKKIEGVWLPVEAEMAGLKFPDEVLKAMKLTMADGKYTVEVGKTLDKGTYKLVPNTKPGAVDIAGTEGPNKGKTLLAIYEWRGESLRVCYDLEGKNRPTEFKTEKNSKKFLVTYNREKP